jgi:hypothetical protein
MGASGNLHLNVVAREYSKKIAETIEPFVYELVGRSPPRIPTDSYSLIPQPNTEAQSQLSTGLDP